MPGLLLDTATTETPHSIHTILFFCTFSINELVVRGDCTHRTQHHRRRRRLFLVGIIKTVTHDGIAVLGLDRHIAVKRMQAFVRKEPFGSNCPAANATTTSTFTNPMNVCTSGVYIL